MTVLFYVAAVFLVLTLAGLLFLRADPGRLAGGMRLVGPVMVGLLGVGLLLFGRAGLGGMLISGALAWHLRSRIRRGAQPTPGKRSTVRTAALEMELDHDSGGLEGVVLAGRFEGRALSGLSLQDLLALGNGNDACRPV